MKSYRSILEGSGSSVYYRADGVIEETITYSNEHVKISNFNHTHIMKFLTLLLCVLLCACTPSPDVTSRDTAQDLVDESFFSNGVNYVNNK